jgi:hypothetical protein
MSEYRWFGIGNCGICGKRAISYYDISITGIGHFLEYCVEHEAEVVAMGQEIDRERKEYYMRRKEWSDNYLPMPVEET